MILTFQMAQETYEENGEEGQGDQSMMDQSRMEGEQGKTYEELVALCTPIAVPMASRKLTKQIYKLLKKVCDADMRKGTISFGEKSTKRAIGKDAKNCFVILGGDVTPIDLISHFPVLCEEKDIPYIFVPSKADLGAALNCSAPCSSVYVKSNENFTKYYDTCLEMIKNTPMPYFD